MTMQNMVEYLEDHGFEATKTYEHQTRKYRFQISKNDFHTVAYFDYPGEDNPGTRNEKQRAFLDFIIRKWNTDFERMRGVDTDSVCGKKTILVGVKSKRDAHREITETINNLMRKAIRITYNKYNTSFDTPHTHVRYVCMDDRFEDLAGYRADAIFGSAWLSILERMKHGADFWANRGLDVTGYIHLVEKAASQREAQIAYPSLKPSFNSVYGFDTEKYINYESEGENNMPTEAERYVRQDINTLAAAFTRVNDAFNKRFPGIKNVIFSGPCTIVLWTDGTKTVVRCEKDALDPEKGLAMAIAKKALGTNKSGSNYYDIFKKWLPKEEVDASCQG